MSNFLGAKKWLICLGAKKMVRSAAQYFQEKKKTYRPVLFYWVIYPVLLENFEQPIICENGDGKHREGTGESEKCCRGYIHTRQKSTDGLNSDTRLAKEN